MNRQASPVQEVKLFAPEGSAEGCASGECLPTEPPSPLSLRERGEERREGQLASSVEEEEPEPPPPVAAAQPRGPATDEEKWKRAVEAVREASPRHGRSLSYARFLGFVPEGVRLGFPPDAAFHRAQVISMSRPMVEGELARSLGRPIKLIEDTSAQAFAGAAKSIAEVEATDRSSRERDIEDKVRSHPALQNVLRHLGGSLEHISYLEPISHKPAAPSPDEGDAGPVVD